MENFPQSFEPVDSDSILEAFCKLKKKVNEINENTLVVEVEEENLIFTKGV